MRRLVAVPLWSLTIGAVFAAGLVLTDIALLKRTHVLALTAQRLSDSLRPPVGVPFPNLHGSTPSGGRIDFDPSRLSRKELVFALSSTCAACETNWPAWERLASMDKAHTLFIDLPGTATEEYLRKHHLTSDVVLSGLDPKWQIALNIRATPTTVIVDKHGRVGASWTGVLTKADETEVSRELGAN